MSGKNRLKMVVPIVILAAGVVGAVIMAKSRKAPSRQERVDRGPLVEVTVADPEDVVMTVSGHGEVVARVAVDVVPQVAGRVVRTHPELVAGGFFRAGQPLVVIEGRDYELAVDKARAAVARAEVALETQRAEAEIARQEWDAIHPDEEPPSGLVVREPQVRQAEAELAAARADLDVARLNLERTRVSLPFDGVVVSKSIDAGQFVGAGQKVARVYGTQAVEVRVPLKVEDLSWFDLPAPGETEGPGAIVRTTTGDNRDPWRGRVVRQEAEVDPVSRMTHVVIEVADPYRQADRREPLRPGTFVEVEIAGRMLEDVVPVPRFAVRDNDTVWVVESGRLSVREVEIARSDRTLSFIRHGLEPGDRIVTSSLDAVTDGMAVRVAAGGQTTDESAAKAARPAAAGGAR